MKQFAKPDKILQPSPEEIADKSKQAKPPRVVALIPARLGSKRLLQKNIQPVNGIPMLAYAIHACQRASLVSQTFVSTESELVAQIASRYGATSIKRPAELAADNVKSQDVFKHFATILPDFDIMVAVQPNCPGVKSTAIDNAIRKLLDYNLWEVRSVNSQGLEHGAIWVLRRHTIFWLGLSVYFGTVTDDTMEIHTLEDLRFVEEILKHD